MILRLIRKSELSEGDTKLKKLMGKTYLVRKNASGIQVIEYMCRHQLASLELGKLEGNVITCPRHNWKYDITTGECIFGDGTPLKFCKFEEDSEWIYLVVDSDYE
ncbi:MAG: Rieske (2Fe-2S) protein [Candidatus Hydrogenedentes bacterium]|nr:Rieske (2Fe-2S) protein [Candidatus Hydrogenedentota bacterium]